jgi:hypothetical protein
LAEPVTTSALPVSLPLSSLSTPELIPLLVLVKAYSWPWTLVTAAELVSTASLLSLPASPVLTEPLLA